MPCRRRGARAARFARRLCFGDAEEALHRADDANGGVGAPAEERGGTCRCAFGAAPLFVGHAVAARTQP